MNIVKMGLLSFCSREDSDGFGALSVATTSAEPIWDQTVMNDTVFSVLQTFWILNRTRGAANKSSQTIVFMH